MQNLLVFTIVTKTLLSNAKIS